MPSLPLFVRGRHHCSNVAPCGHLDVVLAPKSPPDIFVSLCFPCLQWEARMMVDMLRRVGRLSLLFKGFPSICREVLPSACPPVHVPRSLESTSAWPWGTWGGQAGGWAVTPPSVQLAHTHTYTWPAPPGEWTMPGYPMPLLCY